MTPAVVDFQSMIPPLREPAIRYLIGKPLQFLARGTGETDGVISHSVWILDADERTQDFRAVHGRATWPAAHRGNPPKAVRASAGQ